MTNTTKPIIALATILFFALFSRVINLGNPSTYYFDEVYHAVTAKDYAKNNPRGYEWWHPAPEPDTAIEWLHPPVSKLFMGFSIYLFGENSFAWRLPGALFGVVVIYLTYLLAFQVTKQQSIALLAAFLASLDGLLLAQSRIAMNDIYVTAFILSTILFYTKWTTSKMKSDLILTSLFMGLSIATKWSGIFLIGVIGFMEGWLLATGKTKLNFKRYFKLVIASVVIPPIIYLLSYSQFFLQGHTIDQFVELHQQIFWYQFNLDATHPYQSQAWQWPLLIKPVWTYVNYAVPGKVGNIYSMSNPFISWFGLISVCWLLVKIIRDKKFRKPPYVLLAASYLLFWLPWVFSPRIMFYYHYTPAIPTLSIILAIYLKHLFTHRKPAYGYIAANMLSLSVIAFIFFYPHWTGIPVTKEFNNLYYWFSSWK